MDLLVLAITHNSPVLSEVNQSLPLLSNDNPTGRKQFWGHLVRSAFAMIVFAPVVLFGGATGFPLANAMDWIRYPSGGLRFLISVSK